MAPTEPCLLGSLPGKGGALSQPGHCTHAELWPPATGARCPCKWLWGKRTVNSSRLCRCAPGHHPPPAGLKEGPQCAGSPRASCAAGLWGLGFRSSLWGSSLGRASRWAHPHTSAQQRWPGCPWNTVWTKPRLAPLSPVEPSAMAAARPGSHWAPTRRCHGPISLLTEILGPGPPPSTTTQWVPLSTQPGKHSAGT